MSGSQQVCGLSTRAEGCGWGD